MPGTLAAETRNFTFELASLALQCSDIRLQLANARRQIGVVLFRDARAAAGGYDAAVAASNPEPGSRDPYRNAELIQSRRLPGALSLFPRSPPASSLATGTRGVVIMG